MKKPDQKTIDEFLRHSNWIEGEYSPTALDDAKEAWRFAYKNLNTKFSVKHVLEIHRLLMKTIRPDIAGQLRTCDVWIGGQQKAFVSKTRLKEQIQSVCHAINLPNKAQDGADDTLAALAQNIHVQFEDVHPFEDGNGRTGRILFNIHRLKMGLLIYIIHEGDEQMQYYQWFKQHYA